MKARSLKPILKFPPPRQKNKSGLKECISIDNINNSKSDISLSALRNEIEKYADKNDSFENDQFQNQFKKQDHHYVKYVHIIPLF